MSRADVLMYRLQSAHIAGAGVNYVVRTTGGAIYVVFVESGTSDVLYTKSLDGGISWSDPITVFTGTVTRLSVWYDRWSNIAAGLIHCAYEESGGSDVLYRSIDTENSDALGTETTIFAGTSRAAGGNLSITRTRGGNLLCHAMIDAGAEGGFFRSVDVGANWTSRTVNETIATQDQIIMLPGWAADNQDGMAFFWDASANEVSRYIYDDSANTWAETSIATSMTDLVSVTLPAFPNFAAAVDISNSRNLLVAWSNADTATADLRCWYVTESAITEVANVVLNSTDDQALCAIGIATDTGYWYVFYAGKSDGSETWNTSVNIYYKVSQDNGTTWGAETQLSNATGTVGWLACAPRFTGDFNVVFGSSAAAFRFMLCSVNIPTGGPVQLINSQGLVG